MKNNAGRDYFFNKCNTYQAKKKKLKEEMKPLKYGRREDNNTVNSKKEDK